MVFLQLILQFYAFFVIFNFFWMGHSIYLYRILRYQICHSFLGKKKGDQPICKKITQFLQCSTPPFFFEDCNYPLSCNNIRPPLQAHAPTSSSRTHIASLRQSATAPLNLRVQKAIHVCYLHPSFFVS
jgi:hypothetical protein